MTAVPAHDDPNETATMLRELFGDNVEAAVTRRVAMAVDDADTRQAMYWLDVQSLLYATPYC